MVNGCIAEIGIDDTDSKNGMCTTYIAHQIVRRLMNNGDSILDYPKLIRLNPNIPWKTRGNGSVSIKFRTTHLDKDFAEACNLVSEYADITNCADPGIVISTLDEVPSEISRFSKIAVSEVVSTREAIDIMGKYGIKYKGWSRKRGLIGALAAIGNRLLEDATFELLVFRNQERWNKKRLVDKKSIIEMDDKTYPSTFNSYDFEKDRVLITPRGPDPTLVGIRGESPEHVFNAYRMLRIGENTSGYMIFKTNQGTNEHLSEKLNLRKIKAYRSGHFRCTVQELPKIRRGGHVYIKVSNSEGSISCAAYEPTGQFRMNVLSLIPGDILEVGGSVRKKTSKHDSIINLEYLEVIDLAEDVKFMNPICKKCGKRMDSQGIDQGFRCENCGFKDRDIRKIKITKSRKIGLGLYLPPARSQRHLTKPKQRYMIVNENRMNFIRNWIGFR
jgi:tRNA(Ile2)-agmatinylcytidine synthase